MVGIDPEIAPLGQIRFILGPLHLELSQPRGLGGARDQLILEGQGQGDRLRGHDLEEDSGDGLLQRLPRYTLTGWGSPRNAGLLTEIVRDNALPAALMIADSHPLPAAPTQHQPLQKGGPFAWGVETVWSIGLTVRSQLGEMGLILLPGDITDMGLMDHHLPLLAGQHRDMGLAIDGFRGPRATKRKDARITGIMEDTQHRVMVEFSPHELTLMRSTTDPAWKRHLVLLEGADRRRGRPRPPKRAKQEADGLLHLPIGIEDDALILGIAEAHRQVELQGCSAGFVENTALQASA